MKKAMIAAGTSAVRVQAWTSLKNVKFAMALVVAISVAELAQAHPVWTRKGEYTTSSFTPSSNNVLKDATLKISEPKDYSGTSLLSCLNDGKVDATRKITSENNGKTTLECTLATATDIGSFRFYSYHTDGGRDGIAVDDIQVKTTASDTWTSINLLSSFKDSAAFGNNQSSSGRLWVELKNALDFPLAKNVTAIKICFGVQDNNWTPYAEIEVDKWVPPATKAALPTMYGDCDCTDIASGSIEGLTWSGDARAYKIDDDVVLVFTDTTAGKCSFDVRPGYAGIGRFLVVAGGGPGGYNGEKGRAAGGGGAGGMLTGDDAVFSSGTYAITVGEGGKPTNSRTVKGANGSDSFISCGGADFCRAKGGGAGGNVGNSESDLALSTGSDGGNGGGGSQCKSSDTVYKGALGGKGVPGQGFDGGRALDSDDKTSWQNSGAGGGAGGKGTDAESLYRGAKGGDGLPSDITGEKIWYAGGGAGGDWVWQEDKFFAGGKGGGGSVNNYGTGSGRTTVTAGTDTLGGGGAGGASAYNKNEWTGPARGGSGVVVVRLTVKKCDMIEGVTATGAAEMYGAGFGKEAETIIVFKDTTPGACSFTLPRSATARVLLVGGGGPGGYNGKTGMAGAGGGAGGMVTNAYAGTAFGRGTYSVTVGAGGKPSTSRKAKGANGGDSVIARQDGVDVFRAKGGGAGGNPTDNNDNAIQYSVGSNGGSGGGGAQGYTTVNGKSEYYGQLGGSGVEGQGHNGGKALDCQKIADASQSDAHMLNSGGGGGAGANGSNAESLWRGGAGGKGLPCDITGVEVWYAGGGAGGVVTSGSENKSFAGGKGGGGSTLSNSKDKVFYAEQGVDGLGGGGGGGLGKSATTSNWTGPGRGGNGVVVVRITEMVAPGLMMILR